MSSAAYSTQWAVGSKQKAEGGNQVLFILIPDTWYLTPESWIPNPGSCSSPTYDLPPTNYLSFQ